MGGHTNSTASGVNASHAFDVETVRKDFPILAQEIYGKPLVYLDNAATTQKPQAVIDALTGYYQKCTIRTSIAAYTR